MRWVRGKYMDRDTALLALGLVYKYTIFIQFKCLMHAYQLCLSQIDARYTIPGRCVVLMLFYV